MLMPPRTEKSPIMRINFGLINFHKSLNILLVTSSWKAPWFLKENKYNFKDLDSTIFIFGAYTISNFAKSGWPVIGQMEVNSWQTKGTKYKLSWWALSKVSKMFMEGLVGSLVFLPKCLKDFFTIIMYIVLLYPFMRNCSFL